MELQPVEKPYHNEPYPMPPTHRSIFCKDLEYLCQMRLLNKVNQLEWGSTTFIQPKKNGTVILLSNFRKLKQTIRRKPFHIPKIQYMPLNLEGLT